MEQIEENSDALGDTKPSKHRLLSVSDTLSLRLGAGRSQVQILSPRYVRTPSTAGNTRENPRKCWGLPTAVLACSRLFPARGTAKGPQRRLLRSLWLPDQNLGRCPSQRHTIGLQSVATVVSSGEGDGHARRAPARRQRRRPLGAAARRHGAADRRSSPAALARVRGAGLALCRPWR